MSEHVILVALQVEADSREAAHEIVCDAMPVAGGAIESWWVAEDDRTDHSDCDSAVFVTPGTQDEASRLLNAAGLTPNWNVTNRNA